MSFPCPRQAYLDKATRQQLNRITGEIEPYTARVQVLLQYSLTFAACAVLVKKNHVSRDFCNRKFPVHRSGGSGAGQHGAENPAG